MRSRLKHLRFITATLLLSLTSPLQLPGTLPSISSAMAAKSAHNTEVEEEKLSIESSPKLNWQQLEIANTVYRECGRHYLTVVAYGSSPLSVSDEKERLKERLQKLQQQLVIRRNLGERTGEAEILNKIGAVYLCLQEYPKALAFHQQALSIYQEISAHEDEASTLGFIGNTYFHAGEYRQVEELFRQKLESLRKNGDQKGEQRILEVMGYYVEGDEVGGIGAWFLWPAITIPPENLSWQQMLEITTLNLFINREIANRKAEGHSLHGIGWTYRNLGQYTQAMNFYQQALVIARERKDYFHEAFIKVDIGVIYIDLGKYDLALEHLQQTLQFVEKNKMKLNFHNQK